MNDLLRKLQFKDQPRIYVRLAPPEFRATLDELRLVTTVRTARGCSAEDSFALYFVDSRAAIEESAPHAARKVSGDGVLWFAYPKKSSKRYETDISRDLGWQALGGLGFEAVRQVAIDDDWSALRFRRVEFIPKLNRARKHRLTDGSGS